MRNKIGIFCMISGALLVLGAAVLFLYNQQEASRAQKASESLMPQLILEMEQLHEQEKNTGKTENPAETGNAGGQTETNNSVDHDSDASVSNSDNITADSDKMTTVEMDGQEYIGFITIPSLELELTIMADWSYERLKTAPCRYSGSVNSDDLVLMAHNYPRHFGNISQLSSGDTIIFTDVNGNSTAYEVIALDVLDPTAIEDMTAGEYDLTLFTCTYSGQSRVTVRCDRVS